MVSHPTKLMEIHPNRYLCLWCRSCKWSQWKFHCSCCWEPLRRVQPESSSFQFKVIWLALVSVNASRGHFCDKAFLHLSAVFRGDSLCCRTNLITSEDIVLNEDLKPRHWGAVEVPARCNPKQGSLFPFKSAKQQLQQHLVHAGWVSPQAVNISRQHSGKSCPH